MAPVDSGTAALLGAAIGAAGTVCGQLISARLSLKAARITADKDLTLQADKMSDARLTSEVERQRKLLHELHVVLSKLGNDHSIFKSYLDVSRETEVEHFRERFEASVQELHSAMAIAQLHFPQLATFLSNVNGGMYAFWENQQNYLLMSQEQRKEFDRSSEGPLAKVYGASRLVGTNVIAAQQEMGNIARALDRKIVRE